MNYIFILVIINGLIALFCIPSIYICEHYKISESPVHLTQLIATALCFIFSLTHIIFNGKSSRIVNNIIVCISIFGSGLWLVFLIQFLLTFDLSGID